MFNLPKLKGTLCPPNSQHVIFFSCDYDYFDRHGYALANSINSTLSWVHVHVHIINEGNIDHTILTQLQETRKFTYTYEDIPQNFYTNMLKNKSRMSEGIDIFKTRDIDYIARRTYLACVRFMRLYELFPSENQYVLQLDCDSILRNGFHMNEFVRITATPAVMPKPKDRAVFIASALGLGTGPESTQFKKLFSQTLLHQFEKGCYWFIDQDVLKSVVGEWKKQGNYIREIGYKWNAWGIKKDDIFSTGKGSKKEDLKFKRAQYKWLPEHWQQKLRKEVLGI